MRKEKWIWILSCILLCLSLAGQLFWTGSHLQKEPFEEVSLTDTLQIRTEEKKSGPQEDEEQESAKENKKQDEEEEDQDKNNQPEEKKENTPQNTSVQVQLPSDSKDSSDGDSQPGDDGSDDGDASGASGDDGNGEDGDGGSGDDEGDDSDPTDGDDSDTDDDSGDEPYDDSQPLIVTDLYSRTITYNELTDDKLPFYAYLDNAKEGMSLRLKLKNSQTSQNGKILQPTENGGHDYIAELARGETNKITIYVLQDKKTVEEKSYYISYVQKKASEEDPEVGDHPPTITTNLDGFTGEMTNRNFTFTVTGKDYKGKYLTASQLEVRLDGTKVTNPTGGPQYEYQMYFYNPVEGDSQQHTITVLGWDKYGNSVYRKFVIDYRYIDTDDEIGTAYIVLDATTVGLDIMEEPYAYRIKQDEPASYAVMAMLEEYGYEVEYGRTLDDGFYVQRISRGGMADGAAIPEELDRLLEADGLAKTGQSFPDSLGEFDFTQGSGWMYSVGGETYAGKSLSSYYLSNGDTLYLRFTLAYGKDIGGSESTMGLLSTYCGKWLNGSYIAEHQWEDSVVIEEATCTEDGRMASRCKICGLEENAQVIPALGHDYVETSRVEPTDTEDGEEVDTCTRCGDTQVTVLPRTGDSAPSEEENPPESSETTDDDDSDGGSDEGSDENPETDESLFSTDTEDPSGG